MDSVLLESVLARIVRRSPDEILAHPNFPAARFRLLQAATLSIAGDDDPRLGQLMNSLGRSALFSVIIGCYFRYRPDDRGTWPTVKSVKTRYLPLGFVRSRALDHVLGRLCVLNLITLERHPLDGRTRLVMPTPRTLELDRRWLSQQFSAVGALYPDNAPGEALGSGDIRYQRALRHLASHAIDPTRAVMGHLGPLHDAVLRQDGLRIITAYLLKASETNTTTLNLPFRDVERAISTSRTHIRNVFRTLEQLGLVRLHEPGGKSARS